MNYKQEKSPMSNIAAAWWTAYRLEVRRCLDELGMVDESAIIKRAQQAADNSPAILAADDAFQKKWAERQARRGLGLA
jgi:hypothetical protein